LSSTFTFCKLDNAVSIREAISNLVRGKVLVATVSLPSKACRVSKREIAG